MFMALPKQWAAALRSMTPGAMVRGFAELATGQDEREHPPGARRVVKRADNFVVDIFGRHNPGTHQLKERPCKRWPQLSGCSARIGFRYFVDAAAGG
jgi:hypothetical protein